MADEDGHQGFYIAFLGIDGIGKTTIAHALESALTQLGLPTQRVSWKRAMRYSTSEFVKSTLSDLYVNCYKLLYSSAVASEVGTVCEAMPNDATVFRREQFEQWLAAISIVSNQPTGPLAASMLEVVGNLLLYTHEIKSIVANNVVAIQETFGFKHVVKDVLLARHLLNPIKDREAEVSLLSFLAVAESFFQHWLQPDAGFLIEGDPLLAWQWRQAQKGRFGLTEDYRIVGDAQPDTFIHMQQESGDIFQSAAKKWGWSSITMKNLAQEENVQNAVTLILADLKGKGFI